VIKRVGITPRFRVRVAGHARDRGWRATCYTTGMEHSPTGAIGTSWERTPWHAVQRAAWEALRNAEMTR
jgi:hypothetical protein